MTSSLFAMTLCLATAATQVSCARFQPAAKARPSSSADARVDFPVRASQLIEASVASGQGESLGRLKDLIVNVQTGQIEAALVSKNFMVRQGSVTGLGEILVPVPWQAIQIGTERKFIVNVDQDKVATRSAADQDGSRGPGFAVHILGFFEAEPSSGMGGLGDDEVESGRGGGHDEPFDEGISAPHPREL